MKKQEKKLSEYNIIFMGTPDFAVPALQALSENNYQISAVISQPNRAKGRKRIIEDTPIAQYAKQQNLHLLQPESINSEEMTDFLLKSEVDLIITAAYGQIVKQTVLDIPRLGCLNIHASLLPKYRGAAPINAAIIAGEEKTGITIMQMDKGMDTGDILYQKSINIGEAETAGELFKRLSLLGAETLIEFLPKFFSQNYKRVEQDAKQATYAMKMERKSGEINWQKTAVQIYNLIRGTQPWPGCYTYLGDKRLKIFSASIIKQGEKQTNKEAGELIGCQDGLIIQCGKDALCLHEIQFESGKKMHSEICSHNYQKGQKLGR